MLTGDPIAPGEQAVAQAKAYLRIQDVQEDALTARLIAAAAELCEQFTGQMLLARGFSEVLAARSAWQRLGASPVRAITGVEALPPVGLAVPLAASDYAVDIDANGDGWMRVISAAGAKRVRVAYQAGLGADWAGAPEALRQGIIRLAAHFHTHRDAADWAAGAGPPAAVTALWRPWRRMRLG